MFWNYLAIYPYFKLDFLKIEFQWKTRFLENQVIGNQTKKKKKKKTDRKSTVWTPVTA